MLIIKLRKNNMSNPLLKRMYIKTLITASLGIGCCGYSIYLDWRNKII
jgi:hypothetical protein